MSRWMIRRVAPTRRTPVDSKQCVGTTFPRRQRAARRGTEPWPNWRAQRISNLPVAGSSPAGFASGGSGGDAHMRLMSDAQLVPIIDNPNAPQIYASRVAGVLTLGGNVTLTLLARRCEYSAEGGRAYSDVAVGHRVMAVEAAEVMVRFLGDYLDKTRPVPEVELPRVLQ